MMFFVPDNLGRLIWPLVSNHLFKRFITTDLFLRHLIKQPIDFKMRQHCMLMVDCLLSVDLYLPYTHETGINLLI